MGLGKITKSITKSVQKAVEQAAPVAQAMGGSLSNGGPGANAGSVSMFNRQNTNITVTDASNNSRYADNRIVASDGGVVNSGSQFSTLNDAVSAARPSGVAQVPAGSIGGAITPAQAAASSTGDANVSGPINSSASTNFMQQIQQKAKSMPVWAWVAIGGGVLLVAVLFLRRSQS